MDWQIPDQKDTPLLNWLYTQRGITDIEKFHNPTLGDLSDPFDFKDMQKAVEFINAAIESKKKIFIHGDFDADGITATSILWDFMYRELTADVLPFIPSRFDEGYGLTKESIENLIEKGAEVIISVDCGVKDIELVNEYSKGIDFVITDHHTIRTAKESKVAGSKVVKEFLISAKAKAVIHPQLSKLKFKEICGAVVSFKLAQALAISNKIKFDYSKYLELAAIGTVCDVMPLIEENRVIVKLGLDSLDKTKNKGLKALISTSNIKGKLSTYHIGFILGPRLNASGRMGDALLGVKALTTNSESLAMATARNLEGLNQDRRDLTENYLLEAEKFVDAKDGIIIAIGEEWSEGIIGLIAGKLAEKYYKPVIVGTRLKSEIKASVRNPLNFNVTTLLSAVENLLVRYGGHAQAAGLTLSTENEAKFVEKIKSELPKYLTNESYKRIIKIDGIIHRLVDVDFKLIEQISLMEPFGIGNRRPLLYSAKLFIRSFTFMGSKKEHIKFSLYDEEGITIEALGFNKADLVSLLSLTSGASYEFVFTIDLDTFRTPKPILKIEYIR